LPIRSPPHATRSRFFHCTWWTITPSHRCKSPSSFHSRFIPHQCTNSFPFCSGRFLFLRRCTNCWGIFPCIDDFFRVYGGGKFFDGGVGRCVGFEGLITFL